MKNLITLIIFIIFTSFSPVYGYSFDCTLILTQVEKFICSNQEIIKLDNELSIVYNEAVLKDRDTIYTQQAWINGTRSCESNLSTLEMCIKKTYAERIEILKKEVELKKLDPSLLENKTENIIKSTRIINQRFLIDNTEFLDEEKSNYLIKKLKSSEDNGNSVIVELINISNNEVLSLYSKNLLEKRRKDVAIVIDIENKKTYISVTEGLSYAISNKELNEFIDKYLEPQLKKHDYFTVITFTLSFFDDIFKKNNENKNLIKIKQDELSAKNEKEITYNSEVQYTSKINEKNEVVNSVTNQSMENSSNNLVSDVFAKNILNITKDICLVILIIAGLFAIVSVPFSLYLRFRGGVIILENLTDAAFTLGSLIAGFIIIGSVLSMLNNDMKNALMPILSVIYLSGHIIWMYKVSRRSNISTKHIWTVTFSRIIISILPLVYFMLGEKTINGKSDQESDIEYLIRYNKEVELNKRREKERKSMAIIIAALTTLSIDKFSFEGLSSYFKRKTAYI
jgi:uncharacterized protein